MLILRDSVQTPGPAWAQLTMAWCVHECECPSCTHTASSLSAGPFVTDAPGYRSFLELTSARQPFRTSPKEAQGPRNAACEALDVEVSLSLSAVQDHGPWVFAHESGSPVASCRALDCCRAMTSLVRGPWQGREGCAAPRPHITLLVTP